MARWTRLTALGVVSLALCPLVGCSSLDRNTYRSTIELPTNVAVVDNVTHQTIWKMQVPVNHELNVNFNRDDDIAMVHVSEDPAQTMHWELSRINENKANEAQPTPGPTSGSIDMPGHTVMTVVTYRTAPELPGALLPPYIIVQPASAKAKAKPAPAKTMSKKPVAATQPAR